MDKEYLDNSDKDRTKHKCSICPDGSDCSPQGNLKIQPTLDTLQPLPQDYWHVPWTETNDPQFVRCPYRDRCSLTGCANRTLGPLCAVCSPNHYRSATTECLECTKDTVRLKIGILSAVLLSFFLLAWSQRKRIQRIRAKYGAAWKDIVRIVTINLSYCQVSSSLPSIIDIPWPTKYLELLDALSFVNIDVVSLLGIKCAGGELWDFRGRLLLACFVPVLVVSLCYLIYRCRRQHVKLRAKHGTVSLKEMTMHSVEYIWDMFDLDGSGEIDEEEFHNLLINLNQSSIEHTHPSNAAMRQEIMTDLRAVKRRHSEIENKHSLVLLRPDFVELVASGKLGHVLRDDWIVWTERQRIREQFLSDMLLVLFLLHAPLSQRGFYFFACTDIGGKLFLRSDYSIECYTMKHNTFIPVAVGFLLFFSFLFPLLILLQLCRHRKRLHTPEIRHRFGFLYASFNRGGEYWEIHEVFRKMILTGLLVFIPGTSRAAVAIVVSVLSVASLNYVKPHKNDLVFWVAQGSFVITTFKYLSVILLSARKTTNNRVDDATNFKQTSDVVGVLLIFLDVVFMAVSFFAVIAVLLVLRSVLAKERKEELLTGVKIVPVKDRRIQRRAPSKMARWLSFDHSSKIHKSTRTLAVETIQENASQHRKSAVKLIQDRQRSRRTSVQARLMARTRAKRTGALTKCTIFQDLDAAAINKVVNTMKYSVVPNMGSDICRQGELAVHFYIIVKGTCPVFVNSHQVAVLRDGDVFGETALFGNASKRYATVSTSCDDVQLLMVSKEEFDELVERGVLNKNVVESIQEVMTERAEEYARTFAERAAHLEHHEISVCDEDLNRSLPEPERKIVEPPVVFTKKVTDEEQMERLVHNIRGVGKKKLEQAFRRLPPNDTDSVDLQGEAINSKGMKNLLKKLKGSKKTIQKVLNRFGLNDYDGGKVVTMEEFLIELGIEW